MKNGLRTWPKGQRRIINGNGKSDSGGSGKDSEGGEGIQNSEKSDSVPANRKIII